MRCHHPQGSRLPALERNILKYRALEMVIILFHAEELKRFVLGSIQMTDKITRANEQRIPAGSKKVFEKAWAALVGDGILTQDESNEVQKLIDYRNDIRHRVHLLTGDLSRSPIARDYFQWSTQSVKYNSNALTRLKFFREKIERGIQSRYVMSLSLDGLIFEAAEKTYQAELRQLDNKIQKQLAKREEEVKRLKAELSLHEAGMLEEFDPHHELDAPSEPLRVWSLLCHPANKSKNGTLTRRGIEICNWLFNHEKSSLAVAYLMQISYRSALYRRRAWEKGSDLLPVVAQFKAGNANKKV